MNVVVRTMSRSPWTWRAWMALGTPLLLASFVLNMLIDCAMHVYQQWHWEWKYEFKDWFYKFGERHRKSLHSLGLKPEPGGTLVTADRIEHVRHAEDVQ